jgi:putative alpha-1,2-mannosidase
VVAFSNRFEVMLKIVQERMIYLGNVHVLLAKAVLIKVGISAVSCEGARMNLLAEVPDWNFDEVADLAGKAWNKELSRIG